MKERGQLQTKKRAAAFNGDELAAPLEGGIVSKLQLSLRNNC